MGASAQLLLVAHEWRLDAAGALSEQGLGSCFGKRNTEFLVERPNSNSSEDQVISTGGIWPRDPSSMTLKTTACSVQHLSPVLRLGVSFFCDLGL